MNKGAVFHQPDSRYCFAISDSELVIRLRMAKEDKDTEVSLIYSPKYQFHESQEKITVPYVGADSLHAYFEITMALEDTRFAYVFYLSDGNEAYYFSESGLTETYNVEKGYQSFFQMPYINSVDRHKEVDWTSRGTFYQIFVDRFERGDFDKDDTYVNMAWEARPKQRSFAGGDLKGIEEKLSYLLDLGVTCLYLTPIFKSISNHKYDILDYYAIDPQFGDQHSLVSLVKKAHELGIKVVLDAVFNHSSNLLPEFQDVLKYGRDSKYYDWFMIEGDFPEINPLNYETFASVSSMPKWNTSNPEVQDYLLDITRFWMLETQIDGWRLDVSDEVSHDFWRRFRKVVKSLNPEAVIIGENWHDAYPYLQGDQFDSIMNYAFSTSVLSFFTQKEKPAQVLAENLTNLLMRNTKQVNRMNLNLLDSHDTHRFITQLGGDAEMLLAAVAVLLTFEGSPCIYYGTEIALEGGYDPDCRRGMVWGKAGADNAFWLKIRQLLHLRKQEEVLQKGQTSLNFEGDLFKMIRTNEHEEITFYLNAGKSLELPVEGTVLMSHQFESGHLDQFGFIIVKTKRTNLLTE